MVRKFYAVKKRYILIMLLVFIAGCQREKVSSKNNEEAKLIEEAEKESNKISMYPSLVPALENKAKYSAFNLVDGRTDSWCIGRESLREHDKIFF